jgi:nitroimidazol reductase NimA-like FMN-containing flavoprotein (pyridoxamine 5'-phosphate oxidase superfamily)
MTDQPRFNKARNPQRANYEPELIADILDRGLVAHVGFVVDGRPMVMPMAYAADGQRIYLHGASKARIVRAFDGQAVSLTVTLLDGIVLARSGFHHSVNYRSVVVHGRGRLVTDPSEGDRALRLITEHLLPGRWSEVRPMSAQERKATGVVAVEVEAASAKVRSGPPVDDPADLSSGLWGGVLPITTTIGRAIADSYTLDGQPELASLAAARAKFTD